MKIAQKHIRIDGIPSFFLRKMTSTPFPVINKHNHRAYERSSAPSRSRVRLTLFAERSRSTIVIFVSHCLSLSFSALQPTTSLYDRKKIGETRDAKHTARYREGEIRIREILPENESGGLTSGKGARCYFRPLDF